VGYRSPPGQPTSEVDLDLTMIPVENGTLTNDYVTNLKKNSNSGFSSNSDLEIVLSNTNDITNIEEIVVPLGATK